MASDRSDISRIAEIAGNAIREINRIASLNTSASTSGVLRANGSSSIATSTSNRGNVLSELRSRFPTLSSSASRTTSTPTVSRRRGTSSTPGRPSKDCVVKDIVIVGAQVEKTPLGRQEKLLLEQKNRVISGFSIDKTWNDKVLYEKVKEQFPEDCKNIDFQFVKNCYGSLVKPTLATGVKINGSILLRSIASSSAVYVRLFADDLDDLEFERSALHFDGEPSEPKMEDPQLESPGGTGIIDLTLEEEFAEIDGITKQVIKDCETVSNPVEILKYAQEKILTGRQLEITDLSSEVMGESSFILVDRENLLETGLDEISDIKNLRLPIEVNFIGEAAKDFGGPRKEFFRLMLIKMKEKFFDGGLQDELAEKYTTCGVLMGLSVLQNGKIPQFFPEELLKELVSCHSQSPCVRNLQKGLRKVGILQLMVKLPPFLYLFTPSDASALSVKKLIHLLEPKFSEEGSNSRKYQKEVYGAFIRYVKEVAAGRRVSGSLTLNLGHILQFVCGSDEEPILGFVRSPEINFVECCDAFLPTANTCVNILHLPFPSHSKDLPTDEVLFHLYDYAFGNSYFGVM